MPRRKLNRRNAQANPSSSVSLGLNCPQLASNRPCALLYKSVTGSAVLNETDIGSPYRSRMKLCRVIREAFRTLVRQL
jgi:hypothetical protein